VSAIFEYFPASYNDVVSAFGFDLPSIGCDVAGVFHDGESLSGLHFDLFAGHLIVRFTDGFAQIFTDLVGNIFDDMNRLISAHGQLLISVNGADLLVMNVRPGLPFDLCPAISRGNLCGLISGSNKNLFLAHFGPR